MWKVPIVSADEARLCKESPGACRSGKSLRPLPDFYMADYSLLGLQVEEMQKVLRLLEGCRFVVEKKSWGPEVLLEDPARLMEIVTLLTSNGVFCEITDVIDDVYQG